MTSICVENYRRKAFVLTGNIVSERYLFCKNILEKIGFDVEGVIYIPNDDKVLSNKISMQYIYELIANMDDIQNEFVYVFEDDINIIEPITLDEIIQYEKITEMFFYLGLCEPYLGPTIKTNLFINNNPVYQKKGNVRGLHAIGLSKNGARELLNFSKSSQQIYMDVILEEFSVLYPANIVRYDLSSYILGHKGIIFQDRNRFPITIL
jgi:hypothetical protein